MKISGVTYLLATTILLITVAIFAAMDFPFHWVFYLTVLGQVLLVFAVLGILKDNYKTDKTFEDFYEDYPIGKQE